MSPNFINDEGNEKNGNIMIVTKVPYLTLPYSLETCPTVCSTPKLYV